MIDAAARAVAMPVMISRIPLSFSRTAWNPPGSGIT